jgi:assimilatory nitrate reductase catalytic subunit
MVSAQTDPLSGQPESKATPANIAPVAFALQGFARAKESLTFPPGTWWARIAVAGGVEYRLASNQGPLFWHDFAYRALGGEAQLAEDLQGSTYQVAAVRDGELEGCVCLAPAGQPPQWDLPALVATAGERDAGPLRPTSKSQASDYMGGTEAIVCACFQVGLEAVRQAVNSGSAKNVREIGQTLRAGTNCGSCLPELKRIIADERVAHPV